MSPVRLLTAAVDLKLRLDTRKVVDVADHFSAVRDNCVLQILQGRKGDGGYDRLGRRPLVCTRDALVDLDAHRREQLFDERDVLVQVVVPTESAGFGLRIDRRKAVDGAGIPPRRRCYSGPTRSAPPA